MDFLNGQTVTVIDVHARPCGEAIVKHFNVAQRTYTVLFQYPLAEEQEEITLPDWMLQKKKMKEGFSYY